MTPWYEMVREFHLAFGHKVGDHPAALSHQERVHRHGFMAEELQEFLDAEGVELQADAVIDLIYFAIGTMVNMGVEPGKLFDIVHEANMTKLWPDGRPRHRDEDGKVLKPPGWRDPMPRIQSEIARQETAPATGTANRCD